MEPADTERLRIEALKIENESRLREAELAIRRDELNAKIKADQESRVVRGVSPVLATILIAAFGLIGTGIGAILQGFFSIRLERQKFESSLISKAIEAEEESDRAQRLAFYIKIGLISNQEMAKRLEQFIQNPSTIPQVPPVGSEVGTTIRQCVIDALITEGLAASVDQNANIVWSTISDQVIMRLGNNVTLCARRNGYETPSLGMAFQGLKNQNRVTSVAEVGDAIAQLVKR